jgi:hypothetical protein
MHATGRQGTCNTIAWQPNHFSVDALAHTADPERVYKTPRDVYYIRPDGKPVCRRSTSTVESYHSKAHYAFDAARYSPYLFQLKLTHFNFNWNVTIDINLGRLPNMNTKDWRTLEAIKKACLQRHVADPLPWLKLVPMRTSQQRAMAQLHSLPQEAFDALKQLNCLLEADEGQLPSKLEDDASGEG